MEREIGTATSTAVPIVVSGVVTGVVVESSVVVLPILGILLIGLIIPVLGCGPPS